MHPCTPHSCKKCGWDSKQTGNSKTYHNPTTSNQVLDQCLSWRNGRTLHYISRRSRHHLRNWLVKGPQSRSWLGKTTTSLDTLSHYLQIEHHPHDYRITTLTATFPHTRSIHYIRGHRGTYPPTQRNKHRRLHTVSSAIQGSLTIQVKITHSTEIAAWTAPKPSIEHIPTELRQYAKVFNEEALYRLPACQPWDHAINLIPEWPPWKQTGIYSLTPLEEQALKEWPDNSLWKGYIRPSKSPMASSLFFVAKKDRKLWPV